MQHHRDWSSGTLFGWGLRTTSWIFCYLRFSQFLQGFRPLIPWWGCRLQFLWRSGPALVQTILFRGSRCHRCRLCGKSLPWVSSCFKGSSSFLQTSSAYSFNPIIFKYITACTDIKGISSTVIKFMVHQRAHKYMDDGRWWMRIDNNINI